MGAGMDVGDVEAEGIEGERARVILSRRRV